MKMNKGLISLVVFGLISYFFYPRYKAGQLMFGKFPPASWFILAAAIAGAVYYIMENENFWSAMREYIEMMDSPENCFQRYINSNDRLLNTEEIIAKSWIKMKTDWVYFLKTKEGEKFLILNGIKGQPLNPSFFSEIDLKMLGFPNIKSYRMDEKSRLLYDLVSAGMDLKDIPEVYSIEEEVKKNEK